MLKNVTTDLAYGSVICGRCRIKAGCRRIARVEHKKWFTEDPDFGVIGDQGTLQRQEQRTLLVNVIPIMVPRQAEKGSIDETSIKVR